MKSALHQKLLSASGNTVKQEYKAKKCNGYEWQVVNDYDFTNPDPNKRTVQAYEHVSTKPKEDSNVGPNTWDLEIPSMLRKPSREQCNVLMKTNRLSSP